MKSGLLVGMLRVETYWTRHAIVSWSQSKSLSLIRFVFMAHDFRIRKDSKIEALFECLSTSESCERCVF